MSEPTDAAEQWYRECGRRIGGDRKIAYAAFAAGQAEGGKAEAHCIAAMGHYMTLLRASLAGLLGITSGEGPYPASGDGPRPTGLEIANAHAVWAMGEDTR